MYEYFIYEQLKKHAKANKCFHVPGHKARGDFKVKFPVAETDVTELSYSDNLFCPTDAIAYAQRDIAQISGARKSYILTGGSTAGVLAMLYVASRRGNKLLVPRNSHQSVWNACRLFNVEPVIVQGEEREGVILPPSPEQVEGLIENDMNIAGMIVAQPDYYGNEAPLSAYYSVLHAYNRLLIVDGAHGAHLAFEPERKGYAGVYADMWVDGVHKSLPVLTQGAVVSVNNQSLVAELEEAVSCFRTTSPSYPIMASVEYGIKYVANNLKALDEAKAAAEAFKERARANGFVFYPSGDWTKIIIDFKPLGISSGAAAEFLEKRGIYAELSDGRYLLFYVSPVINKKDFNVLFAALLKLKEHKKLAGSYKELLPFPKNERTYSFVYALKHKREYIPLREAEGRMCAVNVGVTPPCIPVVVAGEIISKEAIAVLSEGKKTFGLIGGNVPVVKK
ncbi:MAG: DegT/DnrJ/EryC1/StrS family aminotransferase [Clostridia bacterium]|nr:DegT/DnrJ/EryC1/StrS family aminotransferase [Clostridia bacterium]